MSRSAASALSPPGDHWINAVAIKPIDYMAHKEMPSGPMATPLRFPALDMYVPHSRTGWFMEGEMKPAWYIRKQVKMLTKY